MRPRYSIVLAFVVLIALAGCQPNPASVAGPTPITESAATPTVSAAASLVPAATAVTSPIPPSSQHEALPAPGSLLTAAQHGVTVTLESIGFNSDATVVDYVAAIDPGWGFAFDPRDLPPQQLTQAGLPVAVDENGRTYPARSYAGGPPAQDQVDSGTHVAHTRGRFVFAPVSGAELNLQLRFALMTVRSLPPLRLTVPDPNQAQPVALPPRVTFGPLSAATRSAVWIPARTFALTLEGVKQDGLLLNCLYLYTDPQNIPPDYRGCSFTSGVSADRSDQIHIDPAVDLSRPIEVRVAADVEFVEPFVFKWIRTQAAVPATSPTAADATATYSPPASDRPAFRYIVVAGDTCADIATKFRTTTDKLLAANALPDCTQIRVGMELFIPRSLPYDIKLYVVQPGDTFASIAAAFGLKTETLLWSNADQGATPDNLRVGLVLLVPPVDGAIHLVQAGDTLAQVARRYHVTTAVIVDYPANDLPSASAALLPGSLLVIPGGRLDSPSSSGPASAPAVNRMSYAIP